MTPKIKTLDNYAQCKITLEKGYVINDYVISTDAYQFILGKIKVQDTKTHEHYGEKFISWTTYHPSLSSVIKAIMTDIQLENWPDLKKIIQMQQDIADHFSAEEVITTTGRTGL